MMVVRSNWNSHSLLMGVQKGTSICKDSLGISYKTKLFPYDPIIMPCAIYPDHLKTYVQRKPAYRCFIHKCQNLEVTKMPFSEQMDKYTVVHPDNGILFKTTKKKKKKSCHAMKRHGRTLHEYY